MIRERTKLTLREQPLVERTTSHRFRVHGRKDVAFVDRYDPSAEAANRLRQCLQFSGRFKLAQSRLDRNLTH